MQYILLDANDVVVQRQPYPQEGFIEAPDGVMNGQQRQEDGSYTTPVEIPTSLQIRNEALANISWVRPSDSVEIQIRHPDYASDHLIMERARDKLADGESRAWIDINNSPVTMSKEDMTECLEHGEDEIDRIFAEYILTL